LNHSNSLVPFTSQGQPGISQVGGKGAALIRLTQLGLEVPPGFIVTVNCFQRWCTHLSNSVTWRRLLDTNPNDLDAFTEACDDLKKSAAGLEFGQPFSDQIDTACQLLATKTVAVRSSSPEEDLSGTSFAGLYETYLEVPLTGLNNAIRNCFISCLDARVFLYKHHHGLPLSFPRIAVVVQTQIQSEVSGVLFSLNPMNNDFDEAVINATFGLGEALVAGDITPDSWTVNKLSGEIVNFRLGDKGGKQPEIASLSSKQINDLIRTCTVIEKSYGQPIDLEWAITTDQLFILQARPITTYIPLPKEMMTAPGEPRILYMDESLADGITISGPVTPLTNDLFMSLFEMLVRYIDEDMTLYTPARNGFVFCSGIRIYSNMSYMMNWVNPKLIAQSKRPIDQTYANIIENSDLSTYRKAIKIKALAKLKAVPILLKTLWVSRGLLNAVIKAIFSSQRFQREYEAGLKYFNDFLNRPAPDGLVIGEMLRHYYLPMAKVTLKTTAPALMLYVLRGSEALAGLINQNSTRQVELSEAIISGSDDMVMEMGIRMHELAMLLAPDALRDIASLNQAIKDETIDGLFLDHWHGFMTQFGARGPLEMELAQPKYADDHLLVLKQLAAIARGSQRFDPRIIHQQLKEKRVSAYNELLGLLTQKKRKKLTRAYNTLCTFERSREIPKHHIAQINQKIRTYLLDQAERWLATGRLTQRQQIFELTINEVEQAQKNDHYDLLKQLEERDSYFDQAKRVRHFPHAIDSRGRILRPLSESIEGQLSGTAVSSGIVSGPVKVLHNPFEKDIEEGDILVAHTTDPGWTPLFINAAAVLLEVGGELQHGALVAREYGKPCIAGIVNLTSLLTDGQMVEVDGNTGRVSVLPHPKDQPC
jgi:pyruvate,water dikinase